jgi:RND family efflux transporter MFP subunit
VKAGALAQRDLDQAQTLVSAAEARVAAARAELAAASERLSETVVRAPISGVISAAVNSGDVVSTGAELFTIIDPTTMELYASVAADNVSLLRRGTPVVFQVQGHPGRTFRGTIRRVSPSVNPATRQVDVYVSVPNNSGLLIAGLYASGRIATGDSNGVVIPSEAVASVDNENYVLKIERDQVVRQTVQLGSKDENTGRVQVTSGLEAGDLVLISAATSLRPGTTVEVLRGDSPEPR